jgi:hypothetical protein
VVLHVLRARRQVPNYQAGPISDPLSEARAAARKFLQDPKTHIEARSPADTFKKVADDFIELHVKKEKLRTGDVIEQRIEKHLRPKFDGYELPRSVAAT